MRKLILLASAAAMSVAMPALAKPGNSHGGGHGAHGPSRAHGPAMRSGDHARGDTRYGSNSCPPGLARKHNGCLPPGQAKKLYNVGQRLPAGYRSYTSYNSIPRMYRSRVPYDANQRYIYRDQSVYVVNPRTRLITSIIDLLR
jgi:hypothetical protein